jgi:hypothetical protein
VIARGGKIDWSPSNEEQYQFMKNNKFADGDLGKIGDALKSMASTDFKQVNDWLKANGFDIQLKDPNDPTAFCVASILKVVLKWIEAGIVSTIANENGTFPAVIMRKNVVAFKDPLIHSFPVVKIETEVDTVYMSALESMPKGFQGIQDKVSRLQTVCMYKDNSINCGGVVFPMVDYSQEIDISWIQGLYTSKEDGAYFIDEALQQTKFRMNEIGAVAESAAACTCKMRCIVREDPMVYIDRPFVLWIERKGVSIPLFTGIFCEDVWKKPKAL